MTFPISISVIMATYNTEIPMLKEAVDSILNQTFRDFEFLIIDDGTTNGSDAFLNAIRDERVRIIRNSENIGITKSLNVGLKQAKGKYIARMDADDISLPPRLEKEFAYMEAHPDVILCGTSVGILDEENNLSPLKTFRPRDMEEYRIELLFINPGPSHPTAFFRHESLLEHHILYDEKLIYAQDYGMWETISHYGRIFTLEETLLYRRRHRNQITVARRETQIRCDKMTQRKILTALLGNVSDAEAELHYVHSTEYYPDAVITPEVSAWYDRLVQANKSRHIYNQKKLEKRISNLKKALIRKTLDRNKVSGAAGIRMIFRYLPFFEAIRMLAGNVKRKMRSS